ncbi:MAG TPA: hypothetical protein VGH84_00740 [Steroidobacteraceae bacterium]
MVETNLYQSWNPTTRRNTELNRDEDGQGYLVYSQDTKPIVESAKAIAASFDPLVKRDITHVARIPYVVYLRLQRLGITKDPVAFNKWLDSREARFFRTDDARKL